MREVNIKSEKITHSYRMLTNMYNTLHGPRGVCIFGEYLYVAERTDNYVAVFNCRTRKYLTKFSSSGSKEGCIFDAHGAYADRDGFVYVCDERNHRIQIF